MTSLCEIALTFCSIPALFVHSLCDVGNVALIRGGEAQQRQFYTINTDKSSVPSSYRRRDKMAYERAWVYTLLTLCYKRVI